MKKQFMLSTAAVAAVALGSTAMADVVVDFNVDGPGGSGVSYTVGGAAGMVAIDVDFTNAGGWTWAGDLLIAFIDSDGNGVEYGGYDGTFGYSSIGDFGSSWDSSESGNWTGSIDLTGTGLSDVASVIMGDGYTNGESTDNWTGMLIFGDAVPAPGALALLGLAGIASRRRRK